MYRFPIRHQLPLLLAILMVIQSALAEQITDYIPSNTPGFSSSTLGFALVLDAEKASEKFSKLMGHFQVPLPAPLAMLKYSTGLGEGLDTNRNVLVAMLTDELGSQPVRPMVLLPVRDYGAFALSIHADVSGDACRVTILGEDILVAKMGVYAILMNVEHRQSLQRLLARAPQPYEPAAAIQEWVRQNDLAMVLLPAGIDRLLDLGRRGQENSGPQLFETIRDSSSMGKLVERIRRSLKLYRAILESTGTQIETAAVGLAMDADGNVRVGVRLILQPDGDLAQVRMSGPTEFKPPVGEAGDPFIVAAGGPLPSGSTKPIARGGRRIFEEFASEYGFEDFVENDWHALEEAIHGALDGVESLSIRMLPGREEEPLIGNVHGILQVADAGRYMESLQKSLEVRNRLVSKSTCDIRYEYKVHPVTIGGIEGLDMVADVASAARDPNVPIFDQALLAMVGKDGALHIIMLPLDQRTILLAIATSPRLTQMVAQFRQERAGNSTAAAASANVQTTMKLLPGEAPWFFMASPQGYLQWLNRWWERVMGPMGQNHQIPEFPATPPIGCALKLVDGQLALDFILPVKTLQGIAQYVQQVEEW
jgi:hypothetical protein